jgi:hypothetical protein
MRSEKRNNDRTQQDSATFNGWRVQSQFGHHQLTLSRWRHELLRLRATCQNVRVQLGQTTLWSASKLGVLEPVIVTTVRHCATNCPPDQDILPIHSHSTCKGTAVPVPDMHQQRLPQIHKLWNYMKGSDKSPANSWDKRPQNAWDVKQSASQVSMSCPVERKTAAPGRNLIPTVQPPYKFSNATSRFIQ